MHVCTEWWKCTFLSKWRHKHEIYSLSHTKTSKNRTEKCASSQVKQKTGLKDVIIINGFQWTPFEWTLLETGSDIKKELMQLVSHAEVMCACEKILQITILIFTTPIHLHVQMPVKALLQEHKLFYIQDRCICSWQNGNQTLPKSSLFQLSR